MATFDFGNLLDRIWDAASIYLARPRSRVVDLHRDAELLKAKSVDFNEAIDEAVRNDQNIRGSKKRFSGKTNTYYGAEAMINVWEPKIEQPDEFSLSHALDSWRLLRRVSPDLYGDNNTRLFTYSTSDSYQATGCYNLLYSGFIQINSEIAMGATIFPLSKYGGSQYDINMLVWKDPKEGHWWMQFGNDYVLGCWPSFLFSYLADGASMIEWGGEVVSNLTATMCRPMEKQLSHEPRQIAINTTQQLLLRPSN
ncbi:uncharacterized protein LOC122004550 [Zingiber officinale]|uniref:uncharacterized protein LOC122004550 n=1 Tax=Zingiber officinale TaxID=94328 RepID=UPI001C4AE212|nr:uncharacterized protein LOC122004550 [Zingiber officinale]